MLEIYGAGSRVRTRDPLITNQEVCDAKTYHCASVVLSKPLC